MALAVNILHIRLNLGLSITHQPIKKFIDSPADSKCVGSHGEDVKRFFSDTLILHGKCKYLSKQNTSFLILFFLSFGR